MKRAISILSAALLCCTSVAGTTAFTSSAVDTIEENCFEQTADLFVICSNGEHKIHSLKMKGVAQIDDNGVLFVDLYSGEDFSAPTNIISTASSIVFFPSGFKCVSPSWYVINHTPTSVSIDNGFGYSGGDSVCSEIYILGVQSFEKGQHIARLVYTLQPVKDTAVNILTDELGYKYIVQKQQKIYVHDTVSVSFGDYTCTKHLGNNWDDTTPTIAEGDINVDGSVSVADLVLLQSYLLGNDVHLPYWRSADLCTDDRLDVFDLCLMRRNLVESAE